MNIITETHDSLKNTSQYTQSLVTCNQRQQLTSTRSLPAEDSKCNSAVWPIQHCKFLWSAHAKYNKTSYASYTLCSLPTRDRSDPSVPQFKDSTVYHCHQSTVPTSCLGQFWGAPWTIMVLSPSSSSHFLIPSATMCSTSLPSPSPNTALELRDTATTSFLNV